MAFIFGWLGVVLFIPVIHLVGIGIARTNKIWKKNIIKQIIGLIILFTIIINNHWVRIIWDAFSAMGFFPYYIMCLLGIVCLFPPTKWYFSLILFLVWPYSVWNLYDSDDLSLIMKIGLIFICLIEAVLPFVFLYLYVDPIGKILRSNKKKNFFLQNFIFLFPTLVMLITIVWNFSSQKPEIYKDEINVSGLSVVCNVNSTECSKWQKNFDASLIPSNSSLGKILRKFYNRNRGALIIWQDEEGRYILPPYISVKNVKKFIKNLQRYRAGYTLESQHVRFQDVQHDPLPNAS